MLVGVAARQAHERRAVGRALEHVARGRRAAHDATAVRREDDRLHVALSDGGEVSARAVILATGATYRRLGVPEIEALVAEREAREQVERLREVFVLVGAEPKSKPCKGMAGLLEEGDEVINEGQDKDEVSADLALIAAAQKVEHYEIATYGGLVQLAKTMGMEEAADILHQTLQEEKDTDQGLTDIAENNINWEAEQEGEGEE